MTETPPVGPPTFDVETLLYASEPKPRVNYFWYAAGGFLLVSLASAYVSERSATGRLIVEGGSVFFTLAVIGAMSLVTMLKVRQLRDAQLQIEAAAELVQLRRWPQAGAVLTQILSQPMRTQGMRFEALLYLTNVLARYDRFEEAIAIYEHLLDGGRVDVVTERAIKLGRAMAMLRLDRLFDADRAIADLRRGEARDVSGGLALIEIYRDVITGHPAEAVETFQLRQDLLRDQLGHRVADAHVLTAKAHDQLGHVEDAQRAFTSATLLQPIDELVRRYPEVKDLAKKYAAARSPDAPPSLNPAGGSQRDDAGGPPSAAAPHPNPLPKGGGTGGGPELQRNSAEVNGVLPLPSGAGTGGNSAVDRQNVATEVADSSQATAESATSVAASGRADAVAFTKPSDSEGPP